MFEVCLCLWGSSVTGKEMKVEVDVCLTCRCHDSNTVALHPQIICRQVDCHGQCTLGC